MKHLAYFTLMVLFLGSHAAKGEEIIYDDKCFDIYQFSDGSFSIYLVDTIQITNPVLVEVEPHYITFVMPEKTLAKYDGRGEDFFLQQDNAYLYMTYWYAPVKSRAFKLYWKDQHEAFQSQCDLYLNMVPPDDYEINLCNLSNSEKIYKCFKYEEGTYDFYFLLIRGGFYNDLHNGTLCDPPCKDAYIPSEALATKYFYKVAAPISIEPIHW